MFIFKKVINVVKYFFEGLFLVVGGNDGIIFCVNIDDGIISFVFDLM